MIRRIATAAVLLACAAVAGCGGRAGVSCQSADRYAGSDSIPPVRVPEGLLPPDESQALVIPPEPDRAVTVDETSRPCLELPPDYFETRPGNGQGNGQGSGPGGEG